VKAAKALVLFSGGQDSTTCLAWALNHYEYVETIGFDYGQRHRVELEVRPRIISALRGFSQWPGTLGDDYVIDLGVLGQISQGALTQDVAIAMQANGLPNTFVPGRNILFMIFAAAVAYRRGIKNIITGVCETDYSGYPDCRDDTMKAVQIALNLGMESRFTIHTPLMWIDKAQTWALADALGQEALLTLIREETHTCYNGDRTQHHEWGWGCGVCPACELRAAGFERFQAMRVG
jgi:7-cyano-7-deazaguanine synthase